VSIERQFDYGLTDSAITERALKNYSVWIWDGVHFMRAMPPFALALFTDNVSFASCRQLLS